MSIKSVFLKLGNFSSKNISFANKESLIGVLFILVSLLFAFKKEILPHQVEDKMIAKRQYSAMKKIRAVVKTASETGAIYAVPSGDRYTLVNVGKNDPGYPALVGALSAVGVKFSSNKDHAKLNLVILYISTLFLVLVIYNIFGAMGLVPFFLGWSAFVFNWRIHKQTVYLVDQHGLVPALVILSFSIALLFFKDRSIKKQILSVVLLGLALSMVKLLRESVGSVMIVAFFISILFYYINSLNYQKIIQGIVLSLTLLGVAKVSYSQLQYAFVAQTKWALGSNYVDTKFEIKSHGVWHNLFLGLGQLENSWGITWGSDYIGWDYAKKVNPSVIYQSDEYYEILKQEYIRYVKENPFEYISNVIKKTFIVIKKSWQLFIFLLFLILLTRISYVNKIFEKFRFDDLRFLYPGTFFALGTLAVPVLTHTNFDQAFFTLMYLLTFFIPLFFINRGVKGSM
jgi:hypothetical protein